VSRGKDLVYDAIGSVYCQEHDMDEARDLLTLLASYGLDRVRGELEDLAGHYPGLAEINDAIAAYEKASGMTYGAT